MDRQGPAPAEREGGEEQRGGAPSTHAREDDSNPAPLGAGAGVLLPAAAIIGVLVIAVGVTVRHLTGRLGTATAPFISGWDPAVGPLAALAAVLLAGAVLAGPRLLSRPRSPCAVAAVATAGALALALALNAARHGVGAWSAVFELGPRGSFEAANEYLPALTAAAPGGHYLLDRFALLVPALPANAAAHPPGLLLLMHETGIRTAGALAALCIAAAAALTPLAYALGRTVVADERRARTAALLTALCPAVLLFGTTSADALYAVLGLIAACLLAQPRAPVRALGAAALAVASLFSWALLAVGAWAVVLAWRREGARSALALGAGCAAAVLAFDALLALTWGYDPLAALAATARIYRFSVASVRPYWYWVLGSPVAWLAMLGIPVAAAFLRATARGRAAAVALALVIATAALLGFTKAETERIWLPFAPLACVAAAQALPVRRLRASLALLALQAFAWQLVFDTIW